MLQNVCCLHVCAWGVRGTSSDGDNGRIFLSLKFLISGFFWVGKLAILGGGGGGVLGLSGEFLGVLKITRFVVVPWLHKEVFLGAC